MTSRFFSFTGGTSGQWVVKSIRPVVGETLEPAERLSIVQGESPAGDMAGASASWRLRGITSNERYINASEKVNLVAEQSGLGRPEATCGALIPIRKSAKWWTLSQDERRAIFEERSHHLQIGMRFLPAIARRLHHCRDLSEHEPFDFLTWFDYAPEHAGAFEDLVMKLRETEEWKYVDREVDVRVVRAG